MVTSKLGNHRFRGYRRKAAIAATVVAMTATTACAGSAGSGGTGSGGGGEAFEYDADQSAVNEVIADLDPVTLKYQAASASPNENRAADAKAFKEYVEERSDGKITVELIWGQAVAGFPEVDDALNDGRLDIAQSIPHYDPSAYPNMDKFNSAMQGAEISASPVRGDLLFGAVAVDLALNTESVLSDFESNGVTPLFPTMAAGTYNLICNSRGAEPEDWRGRMVRVPSKPHEHVVAVMGSTATSLEFTEQYEAFQRNTVQCAVTQLNAAVDGGLLDVAPNLMVFDGAAAPSRPSTALVTGENVKNLPLAYQQIVFDGAADAYSAWVEGVEKGTSEGLTEIADKDGTVTSISDATQEKVRAEVQDQSEAAVESGDLGKDFDKRMDDTVAKWEGILDELGIEDDRSFEELSKDPSEIGQEDYSKLSDRLFEETLLTLRPN